MRSLLACVLVVALGCEQKPEERPPEPAKPTAEPPPVTPPPEAVKPSEPTPVPAGSMPKGLVGGGQMQHCPTAVPGAETSVTAAADSVEVLVTAKDPKAVTDIRADARHLKEVAQKDPGAPKHTGEGEGGGGLGKCPVVLKETQITITDVEGGVKIALKPTKPDQLDWLKKEVEARLAKARTP